MTTLVLNEFIHVLSLRGRNYGLQINAEPLEGFNRWFACRVGNVWNPTAVYLVTAI